MRHFFSESETSEPATGTKCVRPYNLGRRKAAQDETRKRILEASASLLMERGGLAFTIDSVAQAASVTRQTVHNHFGTRVDLLEAVCDDIVNTDAFVSMPEVFQQRDPLSALDILVDIFCRFWGSNRLLTRRIRGLAYSDPELEEVIRARDERRLFALRGFVERYALAAGEDAARLIRRMFALTSFEFFNALSEGDTAPETVASELKQLLRLCLESQ